MKREKLVTRLIVNNIIQQIYIIVYCGISIEARNNLRL